MVSILNNIDFEPKGELAQKHLPYFNMVDGQISVEKSWLSDHPVVTANLNTYDVQRGTTCTTRTI